MCLASPGRKSKLVFSVQKNTKTEKVAKGQATECCVGPGKFDIHIFRSLTPAQFQLLFELSCLWIHWINVSNRFSIKQSQGFIYHWWLLLSGSGSHSGKRCCKLLLNLPAYLVSSQTNLTETFSSSTWRKVVKKKKLNANRMSETEAKQNSLYFIWEYWNLFYESTPYPQASSFLFNNAYSQRLFHFISWSTPYINIWCLFYHVVQQIFDLKNKLFSLLFLNPTSTYLS